MYSFLLSVESTDTFEGQSSEEPLSVDQQITNLKFSMVSLFDNQSHWFGAGVIILKKTIFVYLPTLRDTANPAIKLRESYKVFHTTRTESKDEQLAQLHVSISKQKFHPLFDKTISNIKIENFHKNLQYFNYLYITEEL